MTRAVATRAGAWFLFLIAASQYACAPQRTVPQPRPGDVVSAERAERAGRAERAFPSGPGNPPFYDVRGQRYYVRSTSDGYVETGIASWYGRDFHGQRTSSGEIYDMYQLTAAHTTLPIPTWVEVTNLENGRSVVVRINDRGPFEKRRIIDLSYAAALRLDMIRNGTARVQVRAIDPPPRGGLDAATVASTRAGTEPQPAAAGGSFDRREPAGRSSGGGFALISPAVADEVRPGDRAFRQLFVQVGAFGERANADRVVARLADSGFPNAFIVTDGDGRRLLHRVRVGPLANDAEFDRVTAQLRALGYGDAHLVVDR